MAPKPSNTGVKKSATASATKPKKPDRETAVARVKAGQVKGVVAKPPPLFQLGSVQNKKRWLKLLVYGTFGAGKTHLAGTAVDIPATRDVIMMNAEKGDLTLDDPSGEHEFEHIQAFSVDNYKQVSRSVEWLRLHCRLRDQVGGEADEKLMNLQRQLFTTDEDDGIPFRFNTLIVDSLTEIEAFCVYQLTGITDTTKIDDEGAETGWGEYRKNLHMIARLMRRLRDLPMHVIFTCAAKYSQDESKKRLWTPNMTGQLSSSVQGFVDMVGFLVTRKVGEKENLTRILWVQPTGRWDAKCRFSTFKGTHFVDPTIPKILETVGISIEGQEEE